MRQFRTIVLIALACLLVFGVVAVAASASHNATGVDQHAKFSVAASQTATHAALSSAKRTTYVYITKTGSKYHRNGCQYLAHSKIRKTLSWAKSHGYKPCKVCKPPR
jgi:hypothetical protein